MYHPRGHPGRTRPVMGIPRERLQDLRPYLEAARASGCQSLRQIASYLNSAGLCTTRGRPWVATQVRRAMQRLEEDDRLCVIGVRPITSDEFHNHVMRARNCGYSSLRDIAHYLSKHGIRPVRGGSWNPMQVRRILHRLEASGQGAS